MRLKKLFFYLLFAGLFTPTTNLFAQNISNEGTDFWAVFPTHDPTNGENLATMNINITSRSNSRVTVSCGSYSETRDIAANSIEVFEVDRSQSYIDYLDGNKPLTNRAIHIVVAPGMPKVVAYSHVFANARSAATLILPVESLGQKYFSMNYKQSGNQATGQNYLALIAVEDDTDLTLHKKDGSKLSIKLPKAGDVYEYISTSKEDFTGVFVEVEQDKSRCKRFAAFSGATTITIICNDSSDPLLQQLYSVNSWGKNYGIVPFNSRRYLFRVIAQEDSTTIKQDGDFLIVLNKGQVYESQILTEGVLVNADKLISVAQYSLTQACSTINPSVVAIGDPEMLLLNPVEFNIKNVTVFSSFRNDIQEKYVNVFMRSTKTGTFRVNGMIPSVSWIPMPSDSTFFYAQIPVVEETLTLTADDGFNAIAYGFGQFESYAYSAGTNLYSTSAISLLNLSSGINSMSAACLGQKTNPTLTVPYRLKRIVWKFGDDTNFTDDDLTSPIETFDNVGTKLYTYTSPVEKIFDFTGSQVITAIATLFPEDLPECIEGSDLEFNFEIEVVPLGNANFDIPDICAGTPIQFFDKNNIIGNFITQWKWEFDDVVKTEQNPTHTFLTKGLHTIKLSVANAAGCWSDVYTQTVNVTKDFPQLEFLALQPVCVTDIPLQFFVKEKLNLKPKARIFKGKGVSDAGIFNPATAGVGIHKITYTFSSIEGCTDSVSQDIEVYATTVIDAPATVFLLAGGERMVPVSILSPNPNYNYKYKWTPSNGLSDDTIINPIVSLEEDTEYTLTISIDGFCDVSRKVFVKVLDQLSPPNAFSPNGDGVNDVWNIVSLDSYPNSEITVYNRNGQRVFYSKGYTIPFDGSFQNKPLPVGVYYYRINPNNGRRTVSGSLTIIR